MKTIAPALAAHLAEETTTLARLLKITRRDGFSIGLTDHDRDLVVGGVTYRADGIRPEGAWSERLDMKAKGFEIEGSLSSSAIAQDDIDAGLYDHARVDVFVCNWADPDVGAARLRRGWLGAIALSGARYTAQLRGMHDLLSRRVGETYTPECRHVCGDALCGVDLDATAVSGSVTGVVDACRFADAARAQESGYFQDAVLTWTSGANAPASAEIAAWDAASRTFALWLPARKPIAVGDAYTVTAGCDKRFATCRARFNNAAHYGGFPYLPGLGKVLEYPE